MTLLQHLESQFLHNISGFHSNFYKSSRFYAYFRAKIIKNLVKSGSRQYLSSMTMTAPQRGGFLSNIFRRSSNEGRQSELVRKKFGDPLGADQVSFDSQAGVFIMRHSSNAGDGKDTDCTVYLDKVVTLILNRDTDETDQIGGAVKISTDAMTADRVPYNQLHHAIFKVDAMHTVEEFFEATKEAKKFAEELSVKNDTFTLSF